MRAWAHGQLLWHCFSLCVQRGPVLSLGGTLSTKLEATACMLRANVAALWPQMKTWYCELPMPCICVLDRCVYIFLSRFDTLQPPRAYSSDVMCMGTVLLP